MDKKRKTKGFIGLVALFVFAAFALLGATSVYAEDLVVGNGVVVNLNDTTLTVNDVTISAGGTLNGGSGTINVSGNWTNSGTFTAGTGTVNFIDGTSPATVVGDSTFYNLNMTTTSAKQITLTAGSTQTVGNSIVLQGAASNLLVLRSSSGGVQASINLQPGGTQQTVSYVDVQDNNATGEAIGTNTAANLNSTDSGNNTNWFVTSSAMSAVVGDDIFLEGLYLSLGISGSGSFGTDNDAPAGFHTAPGGDPLLGLSVDIDGFDTGAAQVTGDFFLTHQPYEVFSVAYKEKASGKKGINFAMSERRAVHDLKTESVANLSSGTKLAAQWIGTTDDDVIKVSQVVSFEAADKYYRVDVTMENISANTIYSTRYLRNFNGNNDKAVGGSVNMTNTVIEQFANGDSRAIIKAQGALSGSPPIYLFSEDSRAIVSSTSGMVDDPYHSNVYDSPWVVGRSETNNKATSIVFATGDIAPGGSVTLTYYTSFDDDIDATITTINTVDGISPAITAGATTAYTEGGVAVVMDGTITITDSDTTNMESSTVTISSGFASGDALNFTNQNGITGSYNSSTGVLTLTGSATKANYETALESITFSTTVDVGTGTTENRTISWEVNDGTYTSNSATSEIVLSADTATGRTVGFEVTLIDGMGWTTEDGETQAKFKVRLTGAPTDDVTIGLSSSDNTMGTPYPTSLVFTTDNWNAFQKVTVTGVNDSVDEFDKLYTIILAAATSNDSLYQDLDPDDVPIFLIDDDTADIVVSEISKNTTEGGGSAFFEVVLASQPTADVTLPISVSDDTEGSLKIDELVFTSDNWDSPQKVIVTGLNDNAVDGDILYQVMVGDSYSNDSNYDDVSAIPVDVVNIDDDIAWFVVSEISEDTTETGYDAVFTVALTSQPTADVVIQLSSSDTSEGTLDISSITFTPDNWKAPKEVVVTGVDDSVADGHQTYTIDLENVTSDDGNYQGLDPDDVTVVNIDDDTAGIFLITPIVGEPSEEGDTATFSITLSSEPTADVTITLSSSDTGEGTVALSTITFTSDNWNIKKVITITGVDDSSIDGNQPFTIEFTAATSTDTNYNGLKPDKLKLINRDDDTAGFIITELNGSPSEEGPGTAYFTIRLTSQPTADVTIPISSSDTTEGTLDITNITFTADNWNGSQEIVITGVNDDVDDGDQPFRIEFGSASSNDSNFNELALLNLDLTNMDDDSPGFIVSELSGDTDEDGNTATFTVRLLSEPTADVSFDVSSSDTSEGTVTPTTLVFTVDNWKSPQVVTVTGVDDGLLDGDQPYRIEFTLAASGDAGYNGTKPRDKKIDNLDNDSAGFEITKTSLILENGEIQTGENGDTGTFEVALAAQPTADVTLPISVSDSSEGEVKIASFTFTSINWRSPQKVTVYGLDDNVVDGNQRYKVILGTVTSADGNYNGLVPANVDVVNKDNDTAGFTVTQIGPFHESGELKTTEKPAMAWFTVALNSQPTADVTFPVSIPDDTTEGKIYISSMTFTSNNWSSPQEITIYGLDDNIVDGNQPYIVVLGAATSGDGNYSGLVPANVDVINVDNDTAGFTVSKISGNTGENGDTAWFTVVLNSQPTANVAIPVSVSDATEGEIYISSMTFTPDNWNAPQKVTVYGVADAIVDGHMPYKIVLDAATSSDGNYSGLVPSNVDVINTDDNTAGFTVTKTSTISPIETGEPDKTATFTVVLTKQPTADVTIPISVSDSTEGKIYISSVIFTDNNWDSSQEITVYGLNDDVVDGNQGYKVILDTATSADGNYNGLVPDDVNVTNIDDDTAGFDISEITGQPTEKTGGTGTFTVALKSEPTANVTFTLTISPSSEAQLSHTSLTFTPASWDGKQTVTITGIDDDVADGDQPVTIQFSVASSSDPNYNGKKPDDIETYNKDDDSPGFVITSISGDTSEDLDTAYFEVSLASEPTANVTINISSSDTSEGTVSDSSITFTPADWDTPQAVTVTGVNDAVADGHQSYKALLAQATSSDASYNGIKPDDVDVINIDNETPGIVVSGISGDTSESGSTATFTIQLGSQPTADVTIGVSSSNTLEGTVSDSSLTFTAADWDTAQTVTATGVDDAIVDGDQSYKVQLAQATSSDTSYNGMKPDDVDVLNLDNDTVGFMVSDISGPTAENGDTATFTVRLTAQPTANVTIGVSSSNIAEGTVSPSSLTFTTSNWNTDQTVTVTGVADNVTDGDQEYWIILSGATSADTNYNGLSPDNISVINKNANIILSVASVNGSISPLGRTKILDGSDITYTTTPDTGYYIKDVAMDGVSVGAVESYTFTNIVSDHDIQAKFTVNKNGVVPAYRDDDGDGVSNMEEFGSSGGNVNYDGNGDGIPDRLQSNVASLFTYDQENYVTIETPAGTALIDMRAVSNPSPSDAPVYFPYGLFGFNIRFTGFASGASTTLKIYLPPAASVTTYYKYGPTPDNSASHWYEFLYDGTTGASINGDVVTLYFIDGGKGDDDLKANGNIVDDGGPAMSWDEFYAVNEAAEVIPTLSEWGMILLVLLIGWEAFRRIRQERLKRGRP